MKFTLLCCSLAFVGAVNLRIKSPEDDIDEDLINHIRVDARADTPELMDLDSNGIYSASSSAIDAMLPEK